MDLNIYFQGSMKMKLQKYEKALPVIDYPFVEKVVSSFV